MASVGNDGLFQVGDEVTGSFRCAECDLLVSSPRENDGVLVLPPCPLCDSVEWSADPPPRGQSSGALRVSISSSTVIAGSVSKLALPRDASSTVIREMTVASGASTTLRKSYAPSSAHCFTTRPPSRSISRFTSRRRSGVVASV